MFAFDVFLDNFQPSFRPIVRICRGCVRTSLSPHPDGSRSHQWPRQRPHTKRQASVFHSVPLEVFILKFLNLKSQKLMSHEAFFPNVPRRSPFKQGFQSRLATTSPTTVGEFQLLAWSQELRTKTKFFTGKATLKSSTSTIPAASLHLFFLFLYQAGCVSTLTLIMLYICEALHPLPRKRLLHLIS